MAGNQLNEKMAVYNSVDQKTEEHEKKETAVEELEVNHPRNLQKLKSMDPNTKKKSSFQITGVVVAKPTPTDRVLNEECDSYEDVDETCETHTEDVSSDILDLSKNTDIEPDPSSTEDVSPNLEEPPRDPRISDMTSRFKVVKIETREPFKRGRWTCLDFLDPPAEKLDKGADEAGSGNSSAASSIHYVPGVDDPAKNPLGATVVFAEGYPIVEPQPLLPAVIQNGDYTLAPMVPASQGSSMAILDSVKMPPQDPAPSQSTLTTQPMSSQPQPITSPSQPSTLPAPHMSSQQHDYVQKPFSDTPQSSSKPTNGHIPSIPSQTTTNKQPAPPKSHQGSIIAGQSGVSTTNNTSEVVQNPPDYVAQGQDFIQQPPSQDYLPPTGQDYVNEYLSAGKDFLPPSSSDFTTGTTVNEAAPKSESQPSIKTASISQSDFPGTSQSLNNATVPQSIAAPSSTTQVGDFNSQPKSVTPMVTTKAGSNSASPNNENVQTAELHTGGGESSAFQIPAREEPAKPSKSVEPVAVESDEEAKGASSVLSSLGKTTTTQSILTPPLLEMVSATINAGGIHPSKEDGDERYVMCRWPVTVNQGYWLNVA